MIQENLERVRERIAAAARNCGRDPKGVRLICVTKGIPTDQIQRAVACGVQELGENRVQEAREKQPLLPQGLRWHLVGHLQRNKAKPAVELFDSIHSVDSLGLIETLQEQARHRRETTGEMKERNLEILIQVNVSGEETKFGCRPQEAQGLAQAVLTSKSLTLAGLMTMAPLNRDPEDARPVFHQLRQLRDDLQKSLGLPKDQHTLEHLSMGMSGDFEVAVQEGATLVRIGTAIFRETGP